MSAAQSSATVAILLSDRRLERLLTIGNEMNGILVKIQAASNYLSEGRPDGDGEAVELAREQLFKDLSNNNSEARQLTPVIDEMVQKLQEEARQLDKGRKVNLGLAKIEGLAGTGSQGKFAEEAKVIQKRILETQNLIHALDELERDLTTLRRTPLTCPRCMSHEITYRLTPSDLGFTLYKCEACGNAWKITAFSIRIG